MTWDEFESSYRLLQEITTAGGATTHHALSSEGVVVMVHIVRPGSPVTLLDRAAAVAPERVLERIAVDDASVLVTKFIMEFENLEVWVEARERSTAGPPPVRPPSPSATAPDLAAPAGPPSSPPGSGDQPGEFTQPGDQPGEFTRLFRARKPGGTEPGAPDPPPAEPASPPPPSSGEPSSHDEPGEFTRAFRARESPAGSPKQGEATAPAPPEPRFEPPEPSAAPPAEPKETDPARPAPGPIRPPPPHEPGTFTRLFRAPTQPSAGRDIPTSESGRNAPARGNVGGEFTARFRKPVGKPVDDLGWSLSGHQPGPDDPIPDAYADRLRSAAPSKRPAPPPPPSKPSPPQGPGAYTRIISAQPPSGQPPPVASSPPAPTAASAPSEARGREPAERPSVVPFVVAIVLIVVAAVALILGVALST